MPQQRPNVSKAANGLLWLVTIVLIAAAIAGNWYFAKQYAAPIRAVGVIALILIALIIWLRTTIGAAAWKLTKEARLEMRKVVWPTRQETLQSTMMVIIIVALLSLFLWGIDSLFALIIGNLIL